MKQKTPQIFYDHRTAKLLHPHSHPTTADLNPHICMTIEKGLEFILSHSGDSEPIWPRMISTHATGGGQRVVNNKMEALTWYKA